ncbi:MAG: acnA [Rickettsiaceae bacterium]|jgi:aconitate hydratase|nr:acnA [Rickettsiaceae bacterium]
MGLDSLGTQEQLKIGKNTYTYYSIKKAESTLKKDFSKLPFSLKVLLENLLRSEDGTSVTTDDIKAFVKWLKDKKSDREIAFRPARVLMQDFTGVPAVVDLAAMRDAMKKLGGDPTKINPLTPVDLVIDHSVQVDKYGSSSSFKDNVKIEMERNLERYAFLRWGQKAFDNFQAVPPGTGICHQVNLEYLAKVVWTKKENGKNIAYPDTVVGTDSHTTMINGLSVLGWGVGGIEAEAAMLGQPVSMLIPEVIGFKLSGKIKEGTTATDIVLTVTQILRNKGVVGKFVEYFGPGLAELTLADRATLANMAPEYGATCGIFPIDAETIKYLKLSARDEKQIELVEQYAKAQGMWYDSKSPEPVFTEVLELDLSKVEPCISGPRRPQDRILLKDAAKSFVGDLPSFGGGSVRDKKEVKQASFKIGHGDIAIAAITSCTNTSNPSVMIAAGLVAKKAAALGLASKPWVKTSLAPGSKVVTEYLEASGLDKALDKVGFNLVGYGCTTCIGNSGPLDSNIDDAIRDNDLTVAAVLSGNRNFEGRIHPMVKANYLASPPLVVAYAIAGSMHIDITTDPIGQDAKGKNVYLKDIWPSNKEVASEVNKTLTPKMFAKKYADVFSGDKEWQKIKVAGGDTYGWEKSTYINNPPYFKGMKKKAGKPVDIEKASILALFGDSITTDHISPAGSISKNSPAAKYLIKNKVNPEDFNSYGSRRGNHEVMMRGTFANTRIKNEMMKDITGGYTTVVGHKNPLSIYDAAMLHKKAKTPLVVIAGKDYGMGSSRDWAAKGTVLLGIKAVIAESFERIHRSNLIGMGVLPLTFKGDQNRKTLKLDGTETISITGISKGITPRMDVICKIKRKKGKVETIHLTCSLDTTDEVDYYNNGGILHKVIRDLL